MASGLFGGTGPWDLELGFERGADDGGEGVIVDFAGIGLRDPRAQGFVSGTAGGVLERWRTGGPDVGGQREGFPSGDIPCQQGPQAARFVAGAPVAAGMAMDPQPLRHVLACLGLPTRQPREHGESRWRATMLCPW